MDAECYCTERVSVISVIIFNTGDSQSTICKGFMQMPGKSVASCVLMFLKSFSEITNFALKSFQRPMKHNWIDKICSYVQYILPQMARININKP